MLHDIRQSISHPGARWLAVPARAPGLLVISFNAFRQIEMRHEPHIRLVDPHAERDGSDNYDAILVDEPVLMAGAHSGVQSGMIRQRLDPGPGQGGRGILHLGARQAVDDAGAAWVVLADERVELRPRV